MVIIGIDVSKAEMVGARISKSGVKQETYYFKNTEDDVEKFLLKVKSEHRNVVIVCESTSDYHRVLAMQCFRHSVLFKLLNPITTKQFTRATVRNHKTDLDDALIIAKLGLQGEGRYMSSDDFSFTKSVTRTAARLSQMERSLSLMTRRLKIIEPEEHTVSSTVEMCRESIEHGMKNLRTYAKLETDADTRKLLLSIPGIGPILSDILVAEIGDIKRFHSGKALVAYSGLDPRIKQSGKSLKRNTKITKRGSPYLRHALYFAATMAQIHYEEFKIYHQKKISEGKAYTEATIAAARKLTYRLYAVWKRGTPYIQMRPRE